MKINRTTKCSLASANDSKLVKLREVLVEYGRVVNLFIEQFWLNPLKKSQLLKTVLRPVQTWFSERMKKVAAREAIDMVTSSKALNGGKPTHRSQQMCLSSTIVELKPGTGRFDRWLRFRSIGNGLALDLPINLHRHFHKLHARGRLQASYVVTESSVQFCFEIETGPKKSTGQCVGVDTGIKALASLSTGEQLGQDVEPIIDRVKRCKHGSNGQKRASRCLRQRMNEVAKQVCSKASLVVVENLKGITQNTKTPRRRLGKNMRRTIGRWNVRYWLTRLQMTCEDTNVSFRTVSSWYTSQTCSECGYVDRKNRNGESFRCLKCNYQANADVQASRNILARFLTGPYGAGCKPAVSLTTSG